jgi:hypothetical protein
MTPHDFAILTHEQEARRLQLEIERLRVHRDQWRSHASELAQDVGRLKAMLDRERAARYRLETELEKKGGKR